MFSLTHNISQFLVVFCKTLTESKTNGDRSDRSQAAALPHMAISMPQAGKSIDYLSQKKYAIVSHMLNVWNIYLHLPNKWPKCR